MIKGRINELERRSKIELESGREGGRDTMFIVN